MYIYILWFLAYILWIEYYSFFNFFFFSVRSNFTSSHLVFARKDLKRKEEKDDKPIIVHGNSWLLTEFVWIFCGFVESLNLFSSTIMKSRNSGKVSAKWVPIFSIAFFFIGMLFTNRFFNPFFHLNCRILIWFGWILISLDLDVDVDVDLSIFADSGPHQKQATSWFLSTDVSKSYRSYLRTAQLRRRSDFVLNFSKNFEILIFLFHFEDSIFFFFFSG